MIKLSQAVSGTIVQEKLLATVMRTAIEHAGAERGMLILRARVTPGSRPKPMLAATRPAFSCATSP